MEYDFNFKTKKITSRKSDGKIPVDYVSIENCDTEYTLTFDFVELNPLITSVGTMTFDHLYELLRAYCRLKGKIIESPCF